MSRTTLSAAATGPDDAPTALLERVERALGAVTGIVAAGMKRDYLARRLATEIADNGAAGLLALLDRVERGDELAAREFRNLVTVGYSRFFREPRHWPILGEHLHLRLATGTPVRIWSAACARGEEAWSIAMLATEVAAAQPARDGDWRVLASDIDTAALVVAEQACYDADTLAPVTPERQARYLEPAPGGGRRVRAALRERLDFLRFDLAAPCWDRPPGAPFDAIFLSNLLIYFENDVQARVLANAAACLKPDGILFTSRTEGNLAVGAPWLRACGESTYIRNTSSRHLPASK